MHLSVRARLAIAFGAIGGIGFATIAVATPGIVRTSLEDDLLESEAASVEAELSFVFDETLFDGVVIDGPLTDVFGPSTAQSAFEVTEQDRYLAVQLALLQQTGQLDEIVDAAGGTFVLALDAGLAVLVNSEGTIIELLPGIDDTDRPVLSSSELDQYLLDELGFVAVDDETLVRIDDAPVLLDVVDLDGIDYLVAVDATAVNESVNRTRQLLWAGVPFATAIAALLAWLLTSRALRPVAAITDRAATITSGTLDARVPVPSTDDEIAELATTVNGMLDRIDDDDQRRRRFVSDASHELRTPVAVMRNEAEVALQHPDRVDAAELAEAVADESRRLSDIIDDLLALARHDERGGSPLSEIDLDDIVLAESRRARRTEVSPQQVSAGRIRGVPTDITRLVGHLLDNAARHATSVVEVGLGSSDPDWVVLTVDDDGPGIPERDRDAVFERFTRLDEARTRDGGGAGLGLSVVRETARRCGGSVEVTDAPIGGARFVVRFPAA